MDLIVVNGETIFHSWLRHRVVLGLFSKFPNQLALSILRILTDSAQNSVPVRAMKAYSVDRSIELVVLNLDARGR